VKKIIIACICLVVIGAYVFGYRSTHDTVDAHTASTKQTVATPPKASKAGEEQAKLAAAWKQVVATTPPDGNYDIVVYDSATGATTHYSNTDATYNTASIIKLSILEDTLWQDQQQGLTGLTSEQLEDATPMIENSDNDAATDMWNDLGGQTAIQTFFSKIGATQSTANEAWGLTQTTALDQLKVVNEVAYPSKLLTTASVNQANQLMDQVEADQHWGVSGGVPSGVAVQLKNGWLADADNNGTSGWNINSIGHVHGDGIDYTIAVLTDDNNSEQDGINTIQSLSSATWNTLSSVDKS
jgi:beta-lactamase class A